MKTTLVILGTLLALGATPALSQEEGKTKAAEAAEKAAAEKAAKPAEKEQAAQPAEPAAAEKHAKSGAALELANLAVCEGIEDHAPVGASDSFSGVKKLYCFTNVQGAETPTQVYHRWYVGDRMVNEIPINVKGPRWRCWSEKTILPGWHGDCHVEIATEEGDILGTKEFTIASAAGSSMKEEAHGKAEAAKAKGQEKATEAKEKAKGSTEGEAGHEHEGGDTGHHEGDGHHEGGSGDNG